MKIVASAPTKVVVSGEHAVVYGAPALALPIERRNRVILQTSPGAGVYFVNKLYPQWYWSWKPGGEWVGVPIYRGFYEEVKHILAEQGRSLEKLGLALEANVYFSFSPKGTGNSASIGAAWAHVLYAMLGVKPNQKQLFQAVQAGETSAHGNPSGIDACTVLSGSAQIFQKHWLADGKTVFNFKERHLELPRGTSLFLVETPAPEVYVATSELVACFSQTMVGKKPTEVTPEERKQIIAPFEPITREIIHEFHLSGSPYKLGELFLQNHELLRKGGVVPESLQKVVDLCMAEGALGAKGTGSCGPGGAVLVLCHTAKQHHLFKALKREGLSAITMPPAERGAGVESREG